MFYFFKTLTISINSKFKANLRPTSLIFPLLIRERKQAEVVEKRHFAKIYINILKEMCKENKNLEKKYRRDKRGNW